MQSIAQMVQDSQAHEEWLASLKPGDLVGIFEGWRLDGHRFIYESIVLKRTPTGMIVTRMGEGDRAMRWKSNGRFHISRDSPYADRHLAPLVVPSR